MPGFRFRLEGSLKLAEQHLEEAELKLGEELRKYQSCCHARDAHKARWLAAVEGQREAGKLCPQDLKPWQLYVQKQWTLLKKAEFLVTEQDKVVREARRAVMEAHREAEKYRRLKEKQLQAFHAAERREEQKVLDEAAQVHFFRRIGP